MHLQTICQRHWCWLRNVGWTKTTVLEDLALVASEVGEAVNECRGEKPTEHFGEELADIILRVVGIATKNNIDITKEINKKIQKNLKRGTKNRIK